MRPPSEIELLFSSVVNGILRGNISCTEKEWNGTCKSNLEQIKRGELYVSSNTYQEGGRSVRVVSTSQLEGFHSSLKKLLTQNVSIDVAYESLTGLSLNTIYLLGPSLVGIQRCKILI